ncbi:glycosyltransferase family 39 protein [Streptomyces sp. T-3]|nr:glycosyltransferase family 39 protein [Streptomyces sp. T-3]
MSVRERLFIGAGPAALALALGLWGITREHSMWRDEAATWQAAHRSVPEIWHMLGQHDVVHGLYYLLMHGVFALFGDSLAVLRLPSVLATAAACALTALLGARFAGRWAGIAAGLTLAVIPAVQEHAQEGRPYGLVLAFVVLSTWLLVNALERPGSWRWAAYAGAVLVGALLNWFSLFALAAHAVTVLWIRPDRRRVAGWGIAAGGAVLGALPVVLASRDQTGQIEWIKELGWSTVVGVLITVGLAALCARLPDARVCDERGVLERQTGAPPYARVTLAAVALPLCAVPQFGLITVSLVYKDLWVARYVLFAYVGLALLVGVLLAAIAARIKVRPRVLLPAAVALALLALLPTELKLRTAQSRIDDVLTTATTVAHARGDADGVLYVPGWYRDAALVSPDEFAGLRDLALAENPVESGTLNGKEASARDVERAMLGTHRIVVVTALGSGPLEGDGIKQRVLAEHFEIRSDTTGGDRRVIVYERAG